MNFRLLALSLLFLPWAGRSVALSAEDGVPDFRPAFAEAGQRGDKRIVIPPGVYRLAPEAEKGGVVWTIRGLRDTEIVADGVRLVCTRLTRAVQMSDCHRVTLRGLTVDYDPLPFTQGSVISSAEDRSWIDVRIHAGYPDQPYARIDVVDPATRYRKKGMPFLWGAKTEQREPGVVRVTVKDIGRVASPGDLISLSTGAGPGGIPHAMALDRCASVSLLGVTVHSAPGMGILEADGEGSSLYRECRVVPGPRPAGASEDRILSTSWDAMQTKTVRIGPRVERCEIADAGDDSWSVQSSDFMVLKKNDRALVLASRDEFTIGVDVGDRLKTHNGGPEATIQARRDLSRADAQLDPAILAKLADAPGWSEWKVSPRCIEVVLGQALPVQPGDSLYSPDRMGNGFAFLDNRIRSSGRVLIKAAGRIEGNILDTPHALTVCPEVPGSAAAGIDGLIIRRNQIRRAGWFCPAPWSAAAGALSITAAAKPPILRPAGVFANILIEDNVFEDCAGPNLVITSAQDVTVRGNRFIRPQHVSPPDTGASYEIAKNSVIWIGESERVNLERNAIVEPGVVAGELVVLGRGGKDVRNEGAALAP